jgi:hypothetical protein
MNCALCRRDAPLRNSHVIPEFLYRSLYDSKHRFHQISVDPGQRDVLFQKGLREHLLCDDCEQRLSVSERYASMLLNGRVGVVVTQNGTHLHLSEVEYKKMKLFQLSILWRAGVSSLPAFSQVQLGQHAEPLRQMLLTDDPGRTETYGCITSMLMHEQNILQDLIVPPTWSRLAGHRAYRFVMGGLVLVFIVSSTPPPTFVCEHFLQENGQVIVALRQTREFGFLTDTFAEMHRNGKFES